MKRHITYVNYITIIVSLNVTNSAIGVRNQKHLIFDANGQKLHKIKKTDKIKENVRG